MPSWPAKSLGQHRHIKEQVRERDAKAQEQEGMPPNNPPPATCPKCGAGTFQDDERFFRCGSSFYGTGGLIQIALNQSEKCKDRQIAALTDAFESMKAENSALWQAAKELATLRKTCADEDNEICQILGKALGYPWYKDDQKNFPGATEADGVCVGDHVAASLAMEAADRIAALKAAARWIPVGERLPEAGEDVLVITRGRHSIAMTDKDGRFMDLAARYIEVTAWRPLPEGPEGEGCEND